MFQNTVRIWLVVLSVLMFSGTAANACVGRTIYIGAQENQVERLLAEMLVILINERTGTTVQPRYFASEEQLYSAFKSDLEASRVDIIIEDTADAMNIMNQDRLATATEEFTAAKAYYDKTREVIWLKPFGFRNQKTPPAENAPLIRRAVLTNFPLLPRVLGKLSGAIDDKTLNRMLDKVKSGEKPRNVAKKFLRERKFI